MSALTTTIAAVPAAGLLLVGAGLVVALLALGPKNQGDPTLVGARRIGIQARLRRLSRHAKSTSAFRVNRLLEQSGRQIRAYEWFAVVALIAIALALPAYLWRGPIPAGLIAVFTVSGAWIALAIQVSRRQNEFAEQLPELLRQLSTTLRSGLSLTQAISAVSAELPAPAGAELRRVSIEQRIGRNLDDSLGDLAERMGSEDFHWAARAIEINRRTGGDLAKVLRRLDETMRARNQVRGHVRTLTAEGRISAAVLTVLPPLLLLGISLINPDFLEPLFTTLAGQFVLATSLALLIIGSAWLFRLTRFRY